MPETDLDRNSMILQEKEASLPGDDEALPKAFGRLMLLRRLARGGMGEVFLAATRGIEGAERPCVVKGIRREHLEDKSFRARFLDEARIQAQLQHPGVAQILEASTTADGSPYAVVEYVEGRHLGEVLARSNQLGVRIGWADAVAIGLCFGDALAHVHERTDAAGRPLLIAHRDLSPQNVMVGYGGDLKLIDFGTARGENRRCRTVSGIVFAKPGYVAPEVANQTPGGPQADLYAFGVMLWELVAGHRFLQGDAVEHQARVARGDCPLAPIAKDVGAPERLDAILAMLTAPDLGVRYSTARRAVADLAELLKAAPSLADGDRSVRGRIAHLMQMLYPAEPARSRADFSRRVQQARKVGVDEALGARPGIPEPSPLTSTADDRTEALLVGTRYRLLRRIAAGAMGEVWEAMHVDLGRVVALKLLPEAISRSPDARQRFRSEARAVARLDHPGVVSLHDFGITADGRFYYVMELLAGETLAERLTRGTLTWKTAVRVAIEAAGALSAAHDAGLLHRDITPSNLFLTKDDRVKLIDFGVSRSLETADDAASEAPLVVGTPEYVSPEQAAGAPADKRSDLYALGVVLYEALTGRVPHPLGPEGSPSLPALLTAKITRTALPPSSVVPEAGIPHKLDRILLRVLDRDANRRYASARELQDDLEAVLRVPSQRPSRVSLASGAAALLMSGLLGFAVWQRGGAPVTAEGKPPADAAEATLAGPSVPGPGVLEPGELASTGPDHGVAAPSQNGGGDRTRVADADHDEVLDLDSAPAEFAANVADGAGAVPEGVGAAEPTEVERRVAAILRLYDRGRKTQAHHEMKRLAATHADSSRVQEALSITARGVSAWGEALAAARAWASLEPGPRARIALARLERATLKGDPVATLRAVLAEFPGEPEATRLLESYSSEKLAQR